MKLQKIADFLGIACPIEDEELEITGLASLQYAKKGELSFINQPKYFSFLEESQASAVLIRQQDGASFSQYRTEAIALICDDPYLAIARLSALFAKPAWGNYTQAPNIHPSAVIMGNAVVQNGASIGKNSVIMHGVVVGEGVVIGDDCVIYPNAVIYAESRLGNRVIVHANSVIGSDGFGYAHTPEGEHVKIYHNGIAVLEDDVEVGANTAIDRAVFGETRIKKGTKIDNLVQVGHNCIIGEHSLLAGQAGLAGSTTTGRNVVMGGQSGAAGHLHIGDFTTLTVRSTASKSLAPSKIYSGFPSYEHREWLKVQARIKKLAHAKR